MPRAPLALTLALPLLAGCGGGAPLATEPHPLVATTPAARKEMSLDGALVALPAPGKVTLVDVWQSSCKPCLAEMPHLQALHHDKQAAGLVVLGVAADDNPGVVQDLVKKLGVTYPNLVDAEGQVRGALRVGAELPTTLVFDRHGVVRVVRVGGDAADVRALDRAVDALLAEP
jgi:thiol-disulfide isomerase/thioredoxin